MFIYMPLVHIQLILFEVHLNLQITSAFNLKSVQRSGSKQFQQVMMYSRRTPSLLHSLL